MNLLQLLNQKKKNKEYYNLSLNNYNCLLMVKPEAIINEERFNNLTNGEKITFRSSFDFEAVSQKEIIIEALSLKTEDAEIITLESSKKAVTNSDVKIIITSTVFAAIIFIGAIVCVLYLAGVFPIKQKTKSN